MQSNNTDKDYTALWMNLFTGTLSKGAEIELPVLSGSMSPILCPGDRVKIVCRPWNKCHIGDMIVFKENNQLIVHRLLFRFIMGNTYILYQKGDRNRRGSFITPQQILGKVMEIIKPGNNRFNPVKNYKEKRMTAMKKLVHVLLFMIPRYGKEILQWIISHY